MANQRGVTLPSALIRPTTPPDQVELAEAGAEPEAIEPADGQGRGAVEPRAATRPRRRRGAAPADKVTKRGLHLPDSVWERLQLEAIRKKANVSTVAGEVLDRNLPRLRIEREG